MAYLEAGCCYWEVMVEATGVREHYTSATPPAWERPPDSSCPHSLQQQTGGSDHSVNYFHEQQGTKPGGPFTAF